MRHFTLTFLFVCLLGVFANAQEFGETLLRSLFTKDGVQVIQNMSEEDRNALYNMVYQREDMQKEIDAYRRTIADLEKRVSKLQQKDSLASALNAEMAANDSLEMELRLAGKTIARLQRDSIEHEEYLAGFRPFVREYTKNTLMSRRDCLSWPYSQMTRTGLDSLRNGLSPFANEEGGQVAAFIRDIDSVMVYKRLYDRADSLLRSPLDAAALYVTRDELMQLKEVMPEAQFREFDELDISLSRYKRSVEIFSEFLEAVKSNYLVDLALKTIIDKGRSADEKSAAAKNAAEQVKRTASEYIDDDVMTNRFNRIPYMKEIYENYMGLMAPESLLKSGTKERRDEIETVVEQMLEQSRML